MSLVKIGTRHQVTIPRKIVDEMELKPGDYVEIALEKGKIVILPKEIIDKDDAWYWSRDWQEKEREADEAIAKGELLGPFETAKDGLKALKKKK